MYRANELRVVFEKVLWVGIKPKNLRSVETLTGNRPSNALSSSLSTSQSRVHVTSNPAKLQTSSRSRSSVVSVGSLALMRVDNWWPGLTFYVPFPGQPQGTSRRGKSSDVMGAVRNVRPVFSTIEADVHAQEPRGNHLVLVHGVVHHARTIPRPKPLGYQRPCVSAIRGHAQVALVVFGVLPIATNGQPGGRIGEGEGKCPCHGSPLHNRQCRGLPCLPSVKRAQHPRNCAAGDHPNRVACGGDVAVGRRECGLAMDLVGKCVAWQPRPGLTGIGGSKHREAIPDGVAENDSGGVVEPMHGIEKCAVVVLERLPSGMEGVPLRASHHARPGNGRRMPASSGKP